jgi:ubiquinol-cytochrome c reductase cytochrome b subunit
MNVTNQHLVRYPTPLNLNWSWNWGSLAGLMLGSQMLTGFLLAMHYVGSAAGAFEVIRHLATDVNSGVHLRFAHANGASLMFLVVYMHILRGVFKNSGYQPREMVWTTGVLILLTMIVTAFMGYVLPWGQMSFWGATVITGLAQTLPVVGDPLLAWLWGGLSVDHPTLNRFTSVHICLPFALAGLGAVHIACLHQYGSTNPLGINSHSTPLSFWPAVGLKDALAVSPLLFLAVSLLFDPTVESNALPANPLFTPAHIVPEWYFLWVYGVLRSIPSKAAGVCIVALVFAVLTAAPWLGQAWVGSGRFRVVSNALFFLFAADLCALTLAGSVPITTATTFYGQALTGYFFTYTLYLALLLGRTSTPSVGALATCAFGCSSFGGLLLRHGRTILPHLTNTFYIPMTTQLGKAWVGNSSLDQRRPTRRDSLPTQTGRPNSSVTGVCRGTCNRQLVNS